MATTTTATRITLRPTTTTSQSRTPMNDLFTIPQPVPMPLPLPTTHTTTAQPPQRIPATLRSTNRTTLPSPRPTKHNTLLHRPLTTIPSPTLPPTPFLHRHLRPNNSNNSRMSPSHINASRTPCQICKFLPHPHCTTSPPRLRSITTTRTMTTVSGTQATCPYCALRLRAHKSLCI
jgi:hypothetical protein